MYKYIANIMIPCQNKERGINFGSPKTNSLKKVTQAGVPSPSGLV